jgi:enoyl-CoA hydratase/carnithine racemase
MRGEDRSSIRIERRHLAGWIVLDRHERRNALDRPAIESIVRAIGSFGSDEAVRTIVLAAEGTVFCGGADLKELERRDGREGIRIYASVIEAIAGSTKPVIARVQGPCAGGGVGIVAACHLACGTPEARMLTPEVKAGLFPLMVHALIEDTVGRKTAFAMDLTGRELSAREACDVGLLNEVVEPRDLDATVESWIEELSRIRPATLRRALAALHATRAMTTLERVVALQGHLNEIADDW